MDYHPLTTPNTVITDALNATFLTQNGNELMLQNDMGNTTIQDATTGNIMGLSPGFVPVGMKEHGGILYIASYNPSTKEGELGTIPSPLFNYTYDPDPKGIADRQIDLVTWPDNSGGGEASITEYYNQDYIEICAREFTVCEQFMLGLITSKAPTLKRYATLRCAYSENQENICKVTETSHKTPTLFEIFTRFQAVEDDSDIIIYGMFKTNLYAGLSTTGSYYPLSECSSKRQSYYQEGSNNIQYSNQWFLTQDYNEINYSTIKSSTEKLYNTFPNIPAGKLYLKLSPEE